MEKYYINDLCRSVECKGMLILANTENRAVIGLDSTEREAWERVGRHEPISKKEISNDLFEALVELDFISQNEYKRNRQDEIKLVSAYLHVTNRCNLHCLGCYSFDSKRNCAEDLSIEQLECAAMRLKKAELKSLVISGGEPFLRKDLPELLRYCRKIGIPEIFVITNGTLEIDYGKYRGLVDEITVSVDGYSESCPPFIRDAGIFNKIVSGVEKIKKQDIPVSILPTLHKKNCGEVSKYMELAENLDVPLNFSLLSVCDTAEFHDFLPIKEDLHTLAEALMDTGVPIQDVSAECNLEAGLNCGAGKSIISIDTDGSIYPCHMLHTPELKMGNILETDLKKENLNHEAMNKVEHANVDQIKGCNSCEHRYFCSAGCRARSFYKHGDLIHQDSYCELSKHFYDMITVQLLETLEARK